MMGKIRKTHQNRSVRLASLHWKSAVPFLPHSVANYTWPSTSKKCYKLNMTLWLFLRHIITFHNIIYHIPLSNNCLSSCSGKNISIYMLPHYVRVHTLRMIHLCKTAQMIPRQTHTCNYPLSSLNHYTHMEKYQDYFCCLLAVFASYVGILLFITSWYTKEDYQYW